MRLFGKILLILILLFSGLSAWPQSSVTNRAIELYRSGKYGQAIRAFRRGIRSGALSSQQGLYFIAITYMRAERYRKALRILQSLSRKKLDKKLSNRVARQLKKVKKLISQSDTADGLSEEEAIEKGMQYFDDDELSKALSIFDSIEKKFQSQTATFMLGVIYHKLEQFELSDSYLDQVTDSRFDEDIAYLRSLRSDSSSFSSASEKRFSFSLNYARGANSNPVLDSDFSEIGLDDNDTESQVKINSSYLFYQKGNYQAKVEGTYYSEDYSTNDDVDSETIDLGGQLSYKTSDYEWSFSPIYSKQKQDEAKLMTSLAAYVDYSKFFPTHEYSLGLSYTSNTPDDSFSYLEGGSTSLYATYMKYWNTFFASFTFQIFKSDLTDEEDLIVSNKGWAATVYYAYTKGSWTFPISLKYQAKTYIEDEFSENFVRKDNSITLSAYSQYSLNSYTNLYWENQLTKNKSNLEAEDDNNSYTQFRSVLGITLSY